MGDTLGAFTPLTSVFIEVLELWVIQPPIIGTTYFRGEAPFIM
jgi:hypothetical protein